MLPRRQEAGADAFITLNDLKALVGRGNRDGQLPIIAISFCWLTPSHPDPNGWQLEKVGSSKCPRLVEESPRSPHLLVPAQRSLRRSSVSCPSTRVKRASQRWASSGTGSGVGGWWGGWVMGVGGP